MRARCRNEKIFLKLRPDHLLLSDTRKEGKPPIFRESKRERHIPLDEKLRSDLGWRSWIIENFMDRRHHLHLRQRGGNFKNGKNDMNGKKNKTGTDGGNGKNEYSFPEPSAHFARFSHIRSLV